MAKLDFDRFLGGSPLRVLVQLTLLSLVVGVVFSGLGISPGDLIRWAVDGVRRVINMGFGAVEEAGAYLLGGAAVVLPIWLVLRLLAMGRKNS